MKTFQCTNCGFEVQKPLAPMTCTNCRQQRVGLFKLVAASQGVPARPAPTAHVPPSVPRPAAPRPAPPQQPAPTRPAQPKQRVPAPPQQPKAPPKQPAAKAPSPPSAPPAPPQPPPAPPKKKAAKPPSVPDTSPLDAPKTPAQPKLRTPAKKPTVQAPINEPETHDTEQPQPAETPKRLVWMLPETAPNASKAWPLRNCPAVDSEGHIYACISGKLIAFIEEDNQVKTLWTYATDDRIPGSPTIGYDGNIRVHSSEGLLHCVSPEGKQVWAPANVGKPLGWAAPVVDEQGNTWISGYSGGLVKVGSDGKSINRRFFPSREKFDSTALIFGGVLFVGAEDGFLYAIELTRNKGKIAWNQLEKQGLTDWFINSATAITPDSVLIAASRDNFLYGFKLDGDELWKTKMPGQVLSSPVVDKNGRVFVAISQTKRGEKGHGLLVSVCGNSHKIQWKYRTDDPSESTPVIGDDGIVYFGDNGGVIHAVNPDGKAEWTEQVGSAVRSAGTILAPHRVAFGLDNETLVALECSSNWPAAEGWPKYMGTLAQSGTIPG